MRDTYSVVKREVDASVEGKVCDFKVLQYYATFYGREPSLEGAFCDPYVQVWADGSITLVSRGDKIFLYEDQWRGIVKAIEMAMKDKKEKSQRAQAEWLAKTANSTEFHGRKVDLSRNQVIEALASSEIIVADGGHPVIVFNDTRHMLCRTDLLDDVAAGLCANKTADEWRAHYLAKAQRCMGGRVKVLEKDYAVFSVIDSMTDG